MLEARQIEWVHARGHSGHPWNELADRVCDAVGSFADCARLCEIDVLLAHPDPPLPVHPEHPVMKWLSIGAGCSQAQYPVRYKDGSLDVPRLGAYPGGQKAIVKLSAWIAPGAASPLLKSCANRNNILQACGMLPLCL